MGFPGVGVKRSTSLKSIEFSDGGFHFRLPRTAGRVSAKLKVAMTANGSEEGEEEARDAHIGIRAGRIRRADACVNEPIVPVLKLRYVDVEYVLDAIGELDLLDLEPKANANLFTNHAE